MNESILHLIGLIVGYVLIRNFVFKKKKVGNLASVNATI